MNTEERRLYISWMHEPEGGYFRLLHPSADQIVELPEFAWALAYKHLERPVMELLKRILPGMPRGFTSALQVKVFGTSVPDKVIQPEEVAEYETWLTASNPHPYVSPGGNKRKWEYACSPLPKGYDPEDEGPWEDYDDILKCVESYEHEWEEHHYHKQKYCIRCWRLDRGGWV